MSGRAGRRGLDDKGVSIVMIDEKISPSLGRALFKGAADPINSAFHLTYNMVLNLMRVEEINPEYMMERSFFQFQNYSTIPSICESKSINYLFICHNINVLISFPLLMYITNYGNHLYLLYRISERRKGV